MSSKASQSTGGVGFLGLLALIFITLKLMHVIDWSWWWVMLPLWGGAAAALALILVFLIGSLITEAMKSTRRRR